MKLNDAQLQRAASLADAIEMSFLLVQDNCPQHAFSADFEAKMQQLMNRVRQSDIKPYKVFMGYAYYAKRSIAAVLIAFLLACVTVPEAVIAGYHKLIDVIEGHDGNLKTLARLAVLFQFHFVGKSRHKLFAFWICHDLECNARLNGFALFRRFGRLFDLCRQEISRFDGCL